MKIVVCMKQVPMEDKRQTNKKNGLLVRESVGNRMNPDDKAALLEVMAMKKEEDEVIALSMGPAMADEVLREAYAYGVDRAVLISDPMFRGADTFGTAMALKLAIQKLGFDLVFTGNSSTDGASGQVGMMLAEFLKVPSVTGAIKVYRTKKEAEGNHPMKKEGAPVAVCEHEKKICFYELKEPCVVTFLKGAHHPGFTKPGAIFEAFREKEVEILDAQALGMDTKNPPSFAKTKVVGTRLVPQKARKEQILIEDGKEAYRYLMEVFKE